jgi:hypothetical protein
LPLRPFSLGQVDQTAPLLFKGNSLIGMCNYQGDKETMAAIFTPTANLGWRLTLLALAAIFLGVTGWWWLWPRMDYVRHIRAAIHQPVPFSYQEVDWPLFPGATTPPTSRSPPSIARRGIPDCKDYGAALPFLVQMTVNGPSCARRSCTLCSALV